MSVKNDPPNDQAEIGDALVSALGFEPTDSKKVDRWSDKGAGGSSSTSDADESSSGAIVADTSADRINVVNAESSETESSKSSNSPGRSTKGDSAPEDTSSSTTNRSSSKSRSRKKSKNSSLGAYESKKDSAAKPQPTKESAKSNDANASATNDDDNKSSTTASIGDKAEDAAPESSDSTSPTDSAAETMRIESTPPPPNQDSIRTPGVEVSQAAKPGDIKPTASVTDTGVTAEEIKRKAADAKSANSNQPSAKTQRSSGANPDAKSSDGEESPEVKTESASVSENDSPLASSPVAKTPPAETEAVPRVSSEGAESDVLVPTAPPVAGVAAADPSTVEPAQPRTMTRPAIPAPSFFAGRRKVQARKVRRVVRHIDPWSVLIFSVLFHLCIAAALLIASVLVWNAAEAAGTIEKIEEFIRDLGDYETFVINGDAIFRAAVGIAGVLTLASSVLLVLMTVMFNLISDLVGGIRITVIEEETVRVKRK